MLPEKPRKRVLQRSSVSHPARGLHGPLTQATQKPRPGPLLFCIDCCAGLGKAGIKPPTLPVPYRVSKIAPGLSIIGRPGSGGWHHSPWTGLSFSEQIMFQIGGGAGHSTVRMTTHWICQPQEIWDSAQAFKHAIHTPVRNRDHK